MKYRCRSCTAPSYLSERRSSDVMQCKALQPETFLARPWTTLERDHAQTCNRVLGPRCPQDLQIQVLARDM